MRLNGMAGLADLRGSYPRDGNACHRLRHLHLVRYGPNMPTCLQVGGNAVVLNLCRHCCGCRCSSTNDEFLYTSAYASSDGSHTEAFSVLPQFDGCLYCHWMCIPNVDPGVSPACVDDDVRRAKALAVVSGLEATSCVHGRWPICVAHVGCEAKSRRPTCYITGK